MKLVDLHLVRAPQVRVPPDRHRWDPMLCSAWLVGHAARAVFLFACRAGTYRLMETGVNLGGRGVFVSNGPN